MRNKVCELAAHRSNAPLNNANQVQSHCSLKKCKFKQYFTQQVGKNVKDG